VSRSPSQINLALKRPAFALEVGLTLPAHGITVLFGASGSGKTTLLRCVAGLEPACQGAVQIAGEVWQDDAQNLFLPTWKRPLGYVFQEASLLDHLDVMGNLRYGMQRKGLAQQSQGLDAAIALLGIQDLLERRAHQLSGGERQRVAIARALALQPRMLLLDEPLASLDHARRQDILPWLERLRDQVHIPMLYVTHDADEVARLADTLVLMEQGRVTAVGPLDQVLLGADAPSVLGEYVGTTLAGVVVQRDTKWHLVEVSVAGGRFWLRDTGLALGRTVRLRVLARDVSISTAAPHHTSIQNLLPCVVRSVAPDAEPSQVLVQLVLGSTVLLARITARAAQTLALQPGTAVWAQVKSVALVD
jgi:molybdate transport system ATP-binding protein